MRRLDNRVDIATASMLELSFNSNGYGVKNPMT